MFDMNRYGCPYRFAIDYLIRNGSKLDEKNNNYGRQVINIVIKVLEEKIKEEEEKMMKNELIKQEAKELKKALLQKALLQAEGKTLHVSEKDIIFTDIVPGEKCKNGGEYGFYTRYSPIPGHPGIYRVYTETTCDFYSCGTGYEGIQCLTESDYKELRKASDEIEAAGNLYNKY